MNIYSNSLPVVANVLSDTVPRESLLQTKESGEKSAIDTEIDTGRDAQLRQSSIDFETAFIAQMLKFSGLTEALTSGGGEDVAAFTDFYIERFAEEIVESGGFGLADRFYEKLKLQSQGRDPEIANVPAQNTVQNKIANSVSSED